MKGVQNADLESVGIVTGGIRGVWETGRGDRESGRQEAEAGRDVRRGGWKSVDGGGVVRRAGRGLRVWGTVAGVF